MAADVGEIRVTGGQQRAHQQRPNGSFALLVALALEDVGKLWSCANGHAPISSRRWIRIR